MKIAREILFGLDLPEDAIEDTIIEKRRWSSIHEIVFKYEDKFYKTWYSCGSTEMQDERAWDDEVEVACVEVRRITKTVEVWEEIK